MRRVRRRKRIKKVHGNLIRKNERRSLRIRNKKLRRRRKTRRR